MLCIECGHPKTQVTNSRPHKAAPRVWRRRACPRCHTIVTTYEHIDTSDQLLIEDMPFSVARLTIKLASYLPESASQADEAMALAQTIGESLLVDKRSSYSRKELTKRIWETLTRYNRKSGLRYGVDYDQVT